MLLRIWKTPADPILIHAVPMGVPIPRSVQQTLYRVVKGVLPRFRTRTVCS